MRCSWELALDLLQSAFSGADFSGDSRGEPSSRSGRDELQFRCYPANETPGINEKANKPASL
jgi:hypothetical protein